jgi:hypothetical protein
VAASSSEYLPAAQDAQEDWPVADVCLPTSHSKQLLMPSLGECFPASHASQEELPDAAANVPAKQSEQSEASAPLDLPLAQARHWLWSAEL